MGPVGPRPASQGPRAPDRPGAHGPRGPRALDQSTMWAAEELGYNNLMFLKVSEPEHHCNKRNRPLGSPCSYTVGQKCRRHTLGPPWGPKDSLKAPRAPGTTWDPLGTNFDSPGSRQPFNS